MSKQLLLDMISRMEPSEITKVLDFVELKKSENDISFDGDIVFDFGKAVYNFNNNITTGLDTGINKVAVSKPIGLTLDGLLGNGIADLSSAVSKPNFPKGKRSLMKLYSPKRAKLGENVDFIRSIYEAALSQNIILRLEPLYCYPTTWFHTWGGGCGLLGYTKHIPYEDCDWTFPFDARVEFTDGRLYSLKTLWAEYVGQTNKSSIHHHAILCAMKEFEPTDTPAEIKRRIEKAIEEYSYFDYPEEHM